ncbi:hypothetical protein [Clostridium sp.]|uniref:hypothetical protein n=1 Tax=Clostridium sp. TaxID=1506 RepID=UPI001D7339C9|nr:hypothetical protein [Clostridium sp.]MBS5305731.1 hypothetical protein [Clostridium sp.]
MREEEILKFADLIDEIAETNLDYGIKMFFVTPEKTKQKCLQVIDRIEEIDELMPSADRSTKGKLSYEKGLLLENLAKNILNIRNIFSVKERVICDSNEIDILLQPVTNNVIYSALLPDYLKDDCLVECKNHKKAIDVTLLGKFYSLIRYKKVKFGFMISNKELTGQLPWDDAIGLTKKLYLRDDTIIINITIKMIKEMLELNESIINIIKNQVNDIKYHTNFENDIAMHPAEKLM